MCITEAENIFHVRLKFLGIHRIPKEDHKVDPIIFNLGSHLLDPAQMTCQIPVDVEIGNLFDQPSGSICGIHGIFAQDSSVCNAEILH